MTDSDVADHLAQLKVKLLKKKLENEFENLDEFESPLSATRNYGSYSHTLQSAMKRRKDLLQKLREQNLLDEFSLPHGLPRIQRMPIRPEHIYQTPPLPLPLPPPPPPPVPEQPRIIQQTLPHQPATIIQQIPQQPPLITQIPSPQPFPAPRSGSIKEDMVEMMLMQNAQMHQIIMQNMMLKSLPPPVYSPANGHGGPVLQPGQQIATPVLVRAEKPRPSTVHHHHYPTPAISTIPSQAGFSMWPPVMQPGLGTQLGGFPSDVHNLPIPINTIQSMPAHGVLGLPQGGQQRDTSHVAEL